MYNIELGEIYDISNREFRRKFSDRNFSWKGKNIIVRNRNLIIRGCIRITVGTRRENDILLKALRNISL